MPIKLPKLNKINVKGNPFCKKNANYKEQIFKILVNIKEDDSQTKEGEKVYLASSEEDDELDEEEKKEKNLKMRMIMMMKMKILEKNKKKNLRYRYLYIIL